MYNGSSTTLLDAGSRPGNSVAEKTDNGRGFESYLGESIGCLVNSVAETDNGNGFDSVRLSFFPRTYNPVDNRAFSG